MGSEQLLQSFTATLTSDLSETGCDLDVLIHGYSSVADSHLLYDVSSGKVDHAHFTSHVHDVVLGDIES